MKKILISLFVLPLLFMEIYGGTTGKLSGKVKDSETGEAMPGAQIMITSMWFEGIEVEMATKMGAIADSKGRYFIINVDPGVYTIEVMMMGYQKMVAKEVRVSTNQTTELNLELSSEAIETEEVLVTASKISVKKSQTSSVRNVSAEDIKTLPTESIQGVVNMQAGVVNGHFRGGRRSEVAYMVDGLAVNDVFSSDKAKLVDVETDVVQDIEIITGTFNAEYGGAMSGVVNAVTRDGGNRFRGSGAVYGKNYYTGHDDVFIGLKKNEFTRDMDYKLNLEGPIIRNLLTFFVNVRYLDTKGYYNGIDRFRNSDYSNYESSDSTQWYSEYSGDGSYVPMNVYEGYSMFSKMTLKPRGGLKLSFTYQRKDGESQGYSHSYKYKPKGRGKSYSESNLYALMLNHSLTNQMFYEFKLSYIDDYGAYYLFEDPLDSRYISGMYNKSSGGFVTGGQEKGHNRTWTKRLNPKFDYTWQMNQNHSLKTGFNYVAHEKEYKHYSIANVFRGTEEERTPDIRLNEQGDTLEINYPYFKPELLGDSTSYATLYGKEPKEFSAYLQDKMEFDEMVINVGLRYDRFDPNTPYPSNLRNPGNQLSYYDTTGVRIDSMMSNYPKASVKEQISPRFGLSYQLGSAAKLHFSYGHFFQMPPLYAMYANHNFMVVDQNFATLMGNPQLKAEKSVKYEIAYWQELVPGMGLEVILHYSDVYNLLSTKVLQTYNQTKYGMYTNKDYGNRKGLELKYDVKYRNFNVYLNYTLQYTRGNADNPKQTFNRAGSSMDPVARLIPMSWDQRHTFNMTVSYRVKNAHATFTGYYGSGTAFTWVPISESPLASVNLYPNNSHKPSTYSVDFDGHYDYRIGKYKLRFSLLIYNLLDRKNEYGVNGTTGRANQQILRDSDYANFRSDFTTVEDMINNPANFSAPRSIKMGIGFYF